ncbi:MAG: hypothetical protein FWC77_08025 [Defluviitaleaceae bacterium]|nr:hypothetical protein [Defluviitaleaceae bacterium]
MTKIKPVVHVNEAVEAPSLRNVNNITADIGQPPSMEGGWGSFTQF